MIKVELTDNEARVLLEIMELGLKKGGNSIADAYLILRNKITQSAMRAEAERNAPQPEKQEQ